MRKPLLLAVVALVALTLLAAGVARPWTAINRSGELIIGTEGQFPPFNYFDERNQLVGFEIDIGNALARALGLRPVWRTGAFDTLLVGLQQDLYDIVIASFAITPERGQIVDFSIPHYRSGGIVVTLPGGPRTAAELRGKTVGVQVATTYAEAVERVVGIGRINTYRTDPEALQELLNGRVDAWVTDRFVALEAIAGNPQARLVTGDLLFTEEIAVAVGKGNRQLLDNVNLALQTIFKDGTYDRISRERFGASIR